MPLRVLSQQNPGYSSSPGTRTQASADLPHSADCSTPDPWLGLEPVQTGSSLRPALSREIVPVHGQTFALRCREANVDVSLLTTRQNGVRGLPPMEARMSVGM